MQQTPNTTAPAAAKSILAQAAGDALSTGEITRRALAAGWAPTGATPERTIASRLATLANDETSSIMRAGRGEYLDAAYLDDEQIAWLEAELELAAEQATDRRDERARMRGLVGNGRNCRCCGTLKSRPADPCGRCGEDPVTHNGDPRELNRAYGWAY